MWEWTSVSPQLSVGQEGRVPHQEVTIGFLWTVRIAQPESQTQKCPERALEGGDTLFLSRGSSSWPLSLCLYQMAPNNRVPTFCPSGEGRLEINKD